MKKIKLLFAAAASVLLAACGNALSVSSPDGRTQLKFQVDEHGQPLYSLSFNGEQIIARSALGIETDRADFSHGLQLVDSRRSSHSETWSPVWGQFSQIENNFNSLVATLRNADGQVLKIEFRVFDDGAGFRYILEGEGSCAVLGEHTRFRMAADCDTHWIAGSHDDDEFIYQHTLLSEISRELCLASAPASHHRALLDTGVNTPVTMKTPKGNYVSIHEAALWHYPAAALEVDPTELCFHTSLASLHDVKAEVGLPFATPWRTVTLGDRAGALAESSLILNLNEPCKIEDTSWIRPMKYVGVWWEMHLKKSIWDRDGRYPHGATTENVKRYIDFAAENGFGGVLVEGWNYGWGEKERFDYTQPYPDFDIGFLTRYAAEKGVEIIGHHETYADVDNYDAQMEDAYAYYESLGIHSVKTGYVNTIRDRLHYEQSMVDHYNRTVTLGAKHHLCIDIHETVHPTGIARTYTNHMSAEGMRGQEYQAWNKGNALDHNTILPFTRNLSGAMDFTPGIFDVRYENSINSDVENPEFFVCSTLAHQLALYVVFYSPIQMAADLPENYRQHPDALQFIRDVPVDWSCTKVTDAEIGDYVVTARRDKHSDNWFVGGITDENRRTLNLKLDFLEPDAAYMATIYRDGDDIAWNDRPTEYVIETREVAGTDTLQMTMAAGGGFAISLRRVE